MTGSPTMLRFHVFGGVLSAPFPFPELREAAGDAPVDWTLRVESAPAPHVETVPVGRDQLSPGVEASLVRTPTGLRLSFDDTGTFDVNDRGATLTWYPVPGIDRELVRVDILGRVLAVAVHERGILCLHGSAVALAGHGIGFLAAKGSGKSTLAMTLAAHGAHLLTDDTLPVDPVTGRASPGVHSVRLWTDAAERFSELGDWRVGLSNKRTFDQLPDAFIQHDAVPLGALYELVPVVRNAGEELVTRTPLAPAHGTITLMTHSKLGALMGGAESLRVFDYCASVAATVPIYRLEVARGLDAVDRVGEMIVGWHS
ncbi:MAG: hypothetical protein IPF98_06870 [Gemmatimonadetes bacterium]|nr:hypothetical protein [Gemmatimonadota bacterium]